MRTGAGFRACEAVLGLAVLAVFLCGLGTAQERNPGASEDTQQEQRSLIRRGVIGDAALSESSGLCRGPGERLWSINDSGNPAELFLLEADGRTVARYPIQDVKNVDWEALSRWPAKQHDWLLIADVGDNERRRNRYPLYLVPQPASAATGVKAERLKARKLELMYAAENGNEPPARNCEAVGVDPLTGDIWLVEKIELTRSSDEPPGIFRVRYQRCWFESPVPDDCSSQVTAERIGSFPIRNVTGMAFSPDGRLLVIRNYFNAHLYRRQPDRSWQQTVAKTKPIAVALPLQRQGEAICFTADSKALLVTSEKTNQPLWQVPLPREAAAADPKQ